MGDYRFPSDSNGKIFMYLQRIGQCSGGNNLSADRYPIDHDKYNKQLFQVAVCVFKLSLIGDFFLTQIGENRLTLNWSISPDPNISMSFPLVMN